MRCFNQFKIWYFKIHVQSSIRVKTLFEAYFANNKRQIFFRGGGGSVSNVKKLDVKRQILKEKL